jgi:PEP-CTERM motif
VLSQGGVGVDDIHLIGDSESDRTPSGLWPADHAGVVATLEIPIGSGAVPEPSTWAMMLLGFVGLSVVGRSQMSKTRKPRPRPA